MINEQQPTEWISSMVVVSKPGKMRICLDPQDLNIAIKRPTIKCQHLWAVTKIEQCIFFSTPDAKDGFYQIALDDESITLTTLWKPTGRSI